MSVIFQVWMLIFRIQDLDVGFFWIVGWVDRFFKGFLDFSVFSDF